MITISVSKTIEGAVRDVSRFSLDTSTFSVMTSEGKYYASGKIFVVHKGMRLKLTGEMNEGISGKFIYFDKYEIISEQSPSDVELFLTGIPGVGTKTAHKIVEFYGNEVYNQLFLKQDMSNAPIQQRLKDNIESFISDFTSQTNIYTKLDLTALPLRKAYSIYKYLLNHPESDIEHPFEIAKLPFVNIADIKKLNATTDDTEYREKAVAICAVRAKISNPNKEYVEFQTAVRSVKYYFSREKIATGSESTKAATEALKSLVEDQIFSITTIDGKDHIAMQEIEDVKQTIKEFIQSASDRHIENIESLAKETFAKMNIIPSDKQLKSAEAITKGFAIITGGAGTGKSLVISALYKMHESIGLKCSILTPTGKAANRLSDFGTSAMTIHRKVGYNGAEASKNEFDPLDVDTVIVDEASMVDFQTLSMLIKAMPEFASLILVGDDNQLPPVGIGKPFIEAVQSAEHVYKLDRVYRQEGKDGIIKASLSVLQKKLPKSKQGEVMYYKAETPEEVYDTVKKIYKRLIQKYSEEKVKHNTMIITATRDMADNLNRIIRSDIFSISSAMPFVVGDKVMQTINNYDKEVFNGEIGYVRDVSDNVEVELGNKLVRYTEQEFAELDYAYATTVHKAQGSESNIVIFPLVQSIISNVSRELVYTAVTRAKKTLVLITNVKDYYTAVSKSIKNM